jgi:DNA-directed RNA polymerase specialized sigma24 family protein
MVRGVKKALTAEAFGKFLRWLSPNDESAVQEYQSIRLRLVRYFVHKGCSDPDDLFDKTIDVVVGKIEGGGEYPNPAAFCFGVAKNIWRQDLRERSSAAATRVEQNMAFATRPELPVLEQELKCLERCMGELSSGDREIVSQYHWGQGRDKIETRKRLADGAGGVNALRIKMCRIRKELRLCVAGCMKQGAN